MHIGQSRKPVVLLDCDGILADFVTPVLDEVHRLTGSRYSLDDLKTWEIFDTLPYGPEIKSACYARMKEPGACAALTLYPGAKEAVAKIKELADLYILTSPMRSKTWAHERTDRLEKHFKISHDRVIHAHAKHLVVGDVFIDDKPSNVASWRAHHPNGWALLRLHSYSSVGDGLALLIW